MTDYAHPEVLVDTNWVRDHLNDPKVRLVEVDVDTKSYDAGHIPGAVGFNWQTQLQDQVRRDIISQQDLEKLLSTSGIKPTDAIILYGDNSNWFACYAFWILKFYGHTDVRLLNGGRLKWLNESDKPMTTEKPSPAPSNYKISGTHPELRAKLPDVLQIVEDHGQNLIDVRSTDEYTGKLIAPPGMSETAQRPGHVPTAQSIPWSLAANTADGTFKSCDELRSVYFEKGGVDRDKATVTYCRIGERSSHTWFVLTYLLGQNNVRNYDGSWTEYGSVVGVPIER